MRKLITVAALLVAALGLSAVALAGGATVVDDAIWVDGHLYGTVVTPTTFKSPPRGSTDLIYNFDMSGLKGQRSVAEAAPGDRDYNGGRWRVQMVTFTAAGIGYHDPDGDGIVNFEIESDAEVLQEEFEGYLNIVDANFSFECPLLP